MERLTNAEMADMHFLYGVANGNGRYAARLYGERFPNRRLPNHQTFASLHNRLRETGTFSRNSSECGRNRQVRTAELEEQILQRLADNPGTSTRSIAYDLHVSHSTVWRVLRDQQLHPYHLQRVQALMPRDYPIRVEFSRWFLQQAREQADFPANVLFSDEATFTREGIFNQHNAHVWSNLNPHAVRVHGYQERFSVNVWAGIIHEKVIGPYILPSRLNGQIYLTFLQEVIPELLEDIPLAVRRRMWFQHDGAPAHFRRVVREYLNATFPNRWIGRGGSVAWPPRSPDLTCLDFFFWGYMKELVYETPVESVEDLVARIVCAAATIAEQPRVLKSVEKSMLRRCRACIHVNGRNFESFL